ncbi:uncharacterized protein [Anabrus simplex]|uniref:uncharacterized protein n=1 Tax=Anabrus simplex TaxID=316456 RepID=UPI0035A32ABF
MNEMLKLGGKDLLEAVRILVNKCINSGRIPEYWNNAEVRLLFKKGDKENLENYHPFRSMEETTKAMSLDGISFNNQMLHIKRPSNYKPPQGTKEVVSSRSDCPLRIPCNSYDNEFQSKEEATSALFLGGMNHGHHSPNYTISDFSSGAVRELSNGSAGRSDCKLSVGNLPYGIAEFRSPSEATKALILDDINFRGEKMKIKRPFDSQSLDADVRFQNVRIQDDSSSVSGIHRLTNRNEMLPVNDNGLYPAQQKTKAVGFTPGNSEISDPIPAIDSIISRSEVTTSQVLKHVADFQQRGYFGGTEFTAVANLLSVNISVCCANGTKMTYHPNAGPASATVEIQSPKMSSPPIVHGTNQHNGLQGLATSASWDISYPSVDVQIQGHQADNLKQSSSYPSLGSNSPSHCWESSCSSLLTTGVPLKALETIRGTPTHGETNWLIATWNVRGANSVEKQCAIDEIMYSKAVAVAALQESYLPSSCFDTSHYKWLLSANSRQSSQSGVGFLVRRDLASMINRWTSISDYLACLHLRINGQSIAVVTVCIPSDDTIAAATLKNLLSIVSVLPSTSHIFVVGDFNAQIGSDDLKEISKTYIGHCLGHLHSNKNGVCLVNILRECRLYLLSSLFGNSSTIVTWSKGSMSAQVDHILGNCPSSVSQVGACFVPMVDTDHKLIWAITSVLSCSEHSITVRDFSK